MAKRPERTREHYIEALSRNHVERFIFLRGHTSIEPQPDYGYDIVMTTFNYGDGSTFESGQIENGQVYIQLKATDNLKILKSDPAKIAFEIKRRHVDLWQDEPFPVILIIYSVSDNEAYWLHMQPYLNSPDFKSSSKPHGRVTIHLSKISVLNLNAIDTFRGYKTDVLRRIEELRLYE